MLNIKRSGDCGNSPKNQLIEDLSVALATADGGTLRELVTDDVEWAIVGEAAVSGKDELEDAAGPGGARKLEELVIEHVVSHGKAGTVSGRMAFKGSGACEFCDVYEFSNTKGTSVKAIKSFRIDV